MKSSTVGKARLVPSVQELVSNSDFNHNSTIPPRYLLSHPLHQTSSNSIHPHLPVIDIDALLSGEASPLHTLHSASRDWGFFQVVNHGVSASLIDRFKEEVIGFFNLPMEDKVKFWQTETEVEGFGQAFVISDLQKLDWADLFFLVTLPENLRKPHLLPMLPPQFRQTVEEYSSEVKKLAIRILKCMGRGLELEDEGYLSDLLEDGMQFMRMNYYPPCPQSNRVIGLTPHSDSVGLTILLQINEIEGLQIKKEGEWIPVNPLPGAFVVNIGDVLEMLTNGVYRSIDHRAVVNPIMERLSVATFHQLAADAVIYPAPCLINPENPAQFRRVSMSEYLDGLFTRELDSKSYLDLMRIKY